jgi:hypothetical protein
MRLAEETRAEVSAVLKRIMADYNKTKNEEWREKEEKVL